MNHFCRLTSAFRQGDGTVWTTECRPCGWKSQSHKRKADANTDYDDHVRRSS